MSISDYIQRLRQTRENLINQRPNEALIMGFNLLALMETRIQSKGEDYKGTQFAPYTLGYKETRDKGGYQTGFVDFTVSGRMWANTRPVVTANSEEKTTVTIQGGNALTEAKLSGQFKKRGNILTPSQSELTLVRQANQERFNKARAI